MFYFIRSVTYVTPFEPLMLVFIRNSFISVPPNHYNYYITFLVFFAL